MKEIINKKILIAPDSFKGSITAKEFCEVASQAILELAPNWQVDLLPLADGGEGTVEAIIFNLNGQIRECEVQNPIKEKRTAHYGVFDYGKKAIMEMAEASGLQCISSEQRNPEKTTSYGVGEMILDAMDHGCKEILMGIGGSATNDGGMGMLSALGYRFFDKNDNLLAGYGEDLIKVERIDSSKVDSRLKDINFIVACDVDNPLTGENGATMIYGRQKGANDPMLERLEQGMEHYANLVHQFTGKKFDDVAGAGAAGGLGFAFLTFLNAKIEPGFEMMNQVVGIEKMISQEQYDYIITGEGQMNNQTLFGKLPAGICGLGKKHHIPVIAVVGSIGEGYESLYEEGLTAVFSIINHPITLDDAMKYGKEYLYHSVQNITRLLLK